MITKRMTTTRTTGKKKIIASSIKRQFTVSGNAKGKSSSRGLSCISVAEIEERKFALQFYYFAHIAEVLEIT